jgi:hypothetical protein
MPAELSAVIWAPKETASGVSAAYGNWPGVFRPSAGSVPGSGGGHLVVSLRRAGVWWLRESGWGDKRRPQGPGGWMW